MSLKNSLKVEEYNRIALIDIKIIETQLNTEEVAIYKGYKAIRDSFKNRKKRFI